MEKLIKIIVLNFLLITVSSTHLEFVNCHRQCTFDNCQGSGCDGTFDDFYPQVTFQFQTCINFFYAKSIPQTSNSELSRVTSACLNDYATTKTLIQRNFIECISDCVYVQDQDYDHFLFQDSFSNLQPGSICLLESFYQSYSCKFDSTCFDQIGYQQQKIMIESIIYVCEKLNYTNKLTNTEINQYMSSCYLQMATSMENKNYLSPNTYTQDAIDVSKSISECYSVRNFDLSFIFRQKDNELSEDEDENDTELEEWEDKDCENNQCYYEFSNCLEQCSKSCKEDDCYGDISEGYVSYLSKQICREALLQLNEIDKMKGYIEGSIVQDFIKCINELENQYKSNPKVINNLICEKECIDLKKEEDQNQKEQKQDYDSILTFIGCTLIYIFLIL